MLPTSARVAQVQTIFRRCFADTHTHDIFIDGVPYKEDPVGACQGLPIAVKHPRLVEAC